MYSVCWKSKFLKHVCDNVNVSDIETIVVIITVIEVSFLKLQAYF